MSPEPSKRYRGTHTTTYTYSVPVSLQPHILRLYPRPDPGQIVHSSGVEIDPQPEGLTLGLDAWGNNVAWAWFTGEHERLEIVSRFDVERIRTNPFDFVVPSEASTIPPTYATHIWPGLEHYIRQGDPGPSVRQLADDVSRRADGRVLEYAQELSREIGERCRMIVRPEGDPYSGEQTLSLGEGSCRDMAVLYVECCRHVGIAARFVSGYVEQRPEGEPRELHAWAGIYVAGAGWRGYDPTQGLAVTTGHVTLAVAGVSIGAAPVTGTFVNGGATAELHSTIEFEVEETQRVARP